MEKGTVYFFTGLSGAGRLKGAYRVFRVARMLSEQGIDVIVCGICMYSQVRGWNRANIVRYQEVYIKVKRDTLLARNQKGLYTSGKNVVGVGLPFDEPKTPDVTLENDGERSPEALVSSLEARFGL